MFDFRLFKTSAFLLEQPRHAYTYYDTLAKPEHPRVNNIQYYLYLVKDYN